MTTTTANQTVPVPTNRKEALASAEALYENATTLVATLDFWTRAWGLPISEEERALITHNVINARSALRAIENAIHPVEQEIL